jgi:hypothetical protein
MSEACLSNHIDIPYIPAITKGKSEPCDTTASSFITGRAADIRNAVYDALFHVPGGIRVPPTRGRATESTFKDQEIHREIVAGIPLLSTCRQIYLETATTLFSNNYLGSLSRKLLPMGSFDDSIKPGTMTEATGAEGMLRGFDSRKVIIREILLDLDKACPVSYAMHKVLAFSHREDEHALDMWNYSEPVEEDGYV